MRCIWVKSNGRKYTCAWCGSVVSVVDGVEPRWDIMPDCIPVQLKSCVHRDIIDDFPYCLLATQMSEVAEPCPTTARQCDLCSKEKLQQINRITAAMAISHARENGESAHVETNYGKYLGCSGGLGDLIENALTKVGITKERVEQWVGGPCGCEERKQKLNNLTAWAKRALGMESDAERELRKLLEL